jgi:hypothetical protein
VLNLVISRRYFVYVSRTYVSGFSTPKSLSSFIVLEIDDPKVSIWSAREDIKFVSPKYWSP